MYSYLLSNPQPGLEITFYLLKRFSSIAAIIFRLRIQTVGVDIAALVDKFRTAHADADMGYPLARTEEKQITGKNV